ncbi:MAG TPA: endonuclease/exonuclease/phosphatase family protein [Arthrobacter sp.]|nr:endonuclease/exonuclease/phosphatase family protein [Arthrobacter sp.]
MHKGGSREQGRRRRGGTWLWAAAALLCVPGAALAALRLIPWDIGTPWIQLLSVFPASLALTTAALASAVVAVALDARLSRTVLAATVTAVMLLQLGMVLPRVLPAGGTGTAPQAAPPGRFAPGRTVSVMALNVGPTGVDVEALLAEVRGRNVDILALPELTLPTLEALQAAGLGSDFPYRALDVDWAGTGSGIFSVFPLEAEERVPDTVFYQSRAVAAIPGVRQGIHLTAVHVDSPRPGHTPFWRQELSQLGELRPALQDSPPCILLGDFNASQDHREFRDLLATGLTDASQAAGKGLAPTWPANSQVPPFVALDHVLVTPDIGIVDFATFTVPGTDHKAVVAELTFPG